ncbi:hypothetical protein O181_100818 [Austropuccinia psidii MF-1]|uniref:Reverse transcriptase Ty1/copia-type domain-containing protein n=1 Tax=Austropuccinia psidii MF-1 TaxID=1389203 RepID=A0A9Q3JFB6_9BASI|nr:hypothetical protein [Austropuccinia psidii MF-1]
MYCNGSLTNYHEAEKAPQALEWMSACEEELMNLECMGVWEEVRCNSNTQILGMQWVFALKVDSEGRQTRYKAFLVIQGHWQIWNFNFEETFSLTPSFATLHKINKNTFVKPPPGVTIGEKKVLKLTKALYRLKQAGRCWWLHLKNILQEIRFQANENDQSTYTYKHGEDFSMLWILVDDGVLVASNFIIMERLKLELMSRLKLRWDKDINSIVGLKVKREGKVYVLKKPGLIKKLIQADSYLTASQPLPNLKLEPSPALQIDHNYLSEIGMILYLAQAMCPNVMYAVNYLARFAMNAQDNHWEALKHLVDYINTTKHQHSKVGMDNTRKSIEVYIDTNWGGEGSRSQHGFCILFHGTMVAWN